MAITFKHQVIRAGREAGGTVHSEVFETRETRCERRTGWRRQISKSTIRFAAILLGAAGIASGLTIWHGASGSAGDTARADLILYGNVDMREVQLAFNGTDRIETILVEEGAFVRKGQLLASLDRRYLTSYVDRAAAQLDMQKHRLADLQAGSRPSEIRVAQAHVDTHRAESINTAKDYSRKLALGIAGTPQERDKAKAEAEMAAGNLKAAEETLNLVMEGTRPETIAVARYQVQSDEADLALAQHHLEDASLVAPADGIVRNRLLQPGEMASPQKPVLSLALTRPLWVRAYVDEPNLGRVLPGIEAWISTDSFPEKFYKGWIGFISPTAEFTPRAVETSEVRTELVYQVRIFVCDDQGQLRLGMPATIRIRPGAQSATPPASGAECPST